jgi:hypothetical protein
MHSAGYGLRPKVFAFLQRTHFGGPIKTLPEVTTFCDLIFRQKFRIIFLALTKMSSLLQLWFFLS